MACPPVALECTDITMYPIAGCPGFHLHGIDTEILALPNPDLVSVADSVKINQPGLVRVVLTSTI
jgi:hypothetical protein